MKIMSFNTQSCTNYLEKKRDFDIIADAIKKCCADIVGLNEIRNKGQRPDFVDQTAVLSDLTGLKYRYFAKAIDVWGNNPYGNGFLSKYKIESVETIMIPDPCPKTGKEYYETRCILKAKLENSVTVLVTHFGLNEDERQNAVDTVVKNLEKEKCILMGDFNALPNSRVLDPIRARMKDTADLFNKPLLSYPSDNPDRKIDYIFVSHDIDVVAADIPQIIASDHRPHTAVVSL